MSYQLPEYLAYADESPDAGDARIYITLRLRRIEVGHYGDRLAGEIGRVSVRVIPIVIDWHWPFNLCERIDGGPYSLHNGPAEYAQ